MSSFNFHGGFWQSAKGKRTQKTVELLKVLLEESRLSLRDRENLRQNINSGNALPVCVEKCIRNARPTDDGSRQKKFHLLRSRQAIVASGAYDRPAYEPKKDSRNLNKETLQSIMAYGEVCPPACVQSLKTETQENKLTFNEICASDEMCRHLLHQIRSLEQSEFKDVGQPATY